MKNIRSKSFAALSVMLLLSTPVMQSMETLNEDLYPRIATASQELPAQTNPAKSWFSLNSAKGLLGSAQSGLSSLGSSVANKWAARPSLTEVKQALGNSATSLYETAKEHPYITAAIATPVVAATGYGIYRAGKTAVKAVKNKRAENALILSIETAIRNDMSKILNAVKNKANGKTQLQLGAELFPLINQFPEAKQELKQALLAFGAAVVAWDASPDFSVDRLKDVNDVVDVLNQLGLNVFVKPSLKERASALIPSKSTVKKLAMFAAPAAAVGVVCAYNNGYLDNAIATGSIASQTGLNAINSAINAGSNIATKAVKAVSNVDYVGYAAQAKTRIAPATGFVKAHPYAFGAGIATTGLAGSLFYNREAIKNAALKRKTLVNRQTALEEAIQQQA